MKYVIILGENAPCDLYRNDLVGGIWVDAFICEGTYTYCNEVKQRLENE